MKVDPKPRRTLRDRTALWVDSETLQQFERTASDCNGTHLRRADGLAGQRGRDHTLDLLGLLGYRGREASAWVREGR
jgi:hypothetical protein